MKAKERERRRLRWEHYGKLGAMIAAKKTLMKIIDAPTVSAYGKDLAKSVSADLEALIKEMKENRIDT